MGVRLFIAHPEEKVKKYHLEVLNFLGGLKPGSVLDAGAGAGALGRALAEKGFRVFSLDLYPPTHTASRLVRADMNGRLPFADGSFDYVLCCESLQYIENHAGLFREFKRVLKDGGSAVLSIPNLLSAGSRLYFLHRGYYPCFKPIRTVDGRKEWDSIAYNPVSLVEILELAKRNNFELAGLVSAKFKPSNLPLYPILKAVYSIGLLIERNEEKARLLALLSSREVLLGDRLIIHIRHRAG